MVQRYKLHISGLFLTATQDDVVKRFGYGCASKAKIKTCVDSNGNKSMQATLKFRSLDTVNKCISTFNNTTWKGSVLSLKLAKSANTGIPRSEDCIPDFSAQSETDRQLSILDEITETKSARHGSLMRGGSGGFDDSRCSSYSVGSSSKSDRLGECQTFNKTSNNDVDFDVVPVDVTNVTVAINRYGEDDDDDDDDDGKSHSFRPLSTKKTMDGHSERDRDFEARVENCDVDDNLDDVKRSISEKNVKTRLKRKRYRDADGSDRPDGDLGDGFVDERCTEVDGEPLKMCRGGLNLTECSSNEAEMKLSDETDVNDVASKGEKSSKRDKQCERNDEMISTKGLRKRKNLTSIERHRVSNELRQKSLAQRQQEREMAKARMQQSIKCQEVRLNKKIRFEAESSEDDQEGPTTTSENSQCNADAVTENSRQVKSSAKVKLFHESSDDDIGSDTGDHGDSFHIKPQFQGEQGQKLWELQAKLGHDPRFAIDERFADSDKSDDEDVTNEDNERQRSLKILASVVGERAEAAPEKKDKQKVFDMVRFDPSNPDHKRYERDIVPKAMKVQVDIDEIKPMGEQLPVVEKTQYYSVDSSIRLERGEDNSVESTFRLTDLFGDVQLDIEDDKIPWEPDPARESETQCELRPLETETKRKRPVTVKVAKTSPFFKTDDAQVKEGLQFFCQKKPQEILDAEWQKSRSLRLEANRKRERRYLNSHKRPKEDVGRQERRFNPGRGKGQGRGRGQGRGKR